MRTSPSDTVRPTERRGGVMLGIVLIALGAFFLADRFVGFDLGQYGWPLFVIVPGLLLFAGGLATPDVRAGAGLATAGGITTMVGLVLAVQNATGLWATWAYAWALVGPGGTGVGLFLYGLLRRQSDLVVAGARTIGVALALFAAFGLFFEGFIGLSGEPFLVGSEVFPVVLIVAGLILVGLSVLRGRRPS
jgi:hypothetical protein